MQGLMDVLVHHWMKASQASQLLATEKSSGLN
jgi:hypothetical protein